jgi:hypothetical protein
VVAELFASISYAGFHYHHSLVDGGKLGKHVAGHLLRKYFRTEPDDDEH